MPYYFRETGCGTDYHMGVGEGDIVDKQMEV
jgi:hypothetical protein